MLSFLTRLFVLPFYKSNAGFFLFFFFFFFGVVQSGSLLTYHQQLMLSMLDSTIILLGVLFCWMLYHFKCVNYVIKTINSAEGSFLCSLQTVQTQKQLLLLLLIYIVQYLPVLVYSICLITFAVQREYFLTATIIAFFQLCVSAAGMLTYYRRINNWLTVKKSFQLNLFPNHTKPFVFILLYYFSMEKKWLFLSLKALSFLLLFTALVWNRNEMDNDSFIFFFQLIVLTHTVFAYLAVQFIESNLSFHRNLPYRLIQYIGLYLVSYAVLLVPEVLYLVVYANRLMPLTTIFAYGGITIATLFLLTAIQYSENMNRNEYIKVVFVLFFVSTLALHEEAFLFWLLIQLLIALLLFVTGFYKFEKPEEL